MIKSKVIEKLRNGDCVSVVDIGYFPCSSIVEVAGKVGFDCVWFDMEHKRYGLKELAEMTLGCRATNMDAMVRIKKGGYANVMNPLEAGATGLMIPHCLDAEDARQLVSWAKYHPQGKRGFDNAGTDGDYGMSNPSEYIQHANKETFLAVMIEDKEAVEGIEEITSVDGVDIFFLGLADLSLSYGIPFQFDHELSKKAIDRVAKASAKYNKWWGMTIGSVEEGKRLIDKGARFLLHGSDLYAVRDGFLKYRELFKELGIK